MYAHIEKLSQTVLYINLVSAMSDPVHNPGKSILNAYNGPELFKTKSSWKKRDLT